MKRRLLIAGTVAWALVVAGLAYYSSRNDPPTARDQTTIADGLPIVDRVLSEVAAALDAAATVTALSGYTRTDSSCRVTSAREGTRYERVLLVYVRKDAEPATLDRVREALPASYETTVMHGTSTHLLSADAGGFVLLRGGMLAPGQLRFVADTGCRIQDAAVDDRRSSPPQGDRSAVQTVLDTLKVTASEWDTAALPCPSGGTLTTVQAITTGDGAALRATVPAASVVLDDPKLFAYRSGPSGIALHVDDNRLRVTSTTGC